MEFIITMALYALVLILAVEIFRKNYKIATYFFVAVILSSPFWMHTIDGWFRWAKYLSVFLPITVLGLSRIAVKEDKKSAVWNVLKSDKFLWFFYAIVFLNIVEATLKDISLGNYFNAAAGVALCASLPLASKYWRIAKEDTAEIIAYTTFGWSFLYTTWNACFVYAESPTHFAGTLTILLVAFLYPVFKRRADWYIHARCYTLAIHLLARATFDFFPTRMNASSWFNESVLMWWGIINALLGVVYLVWHIKVVRTGSADQSFGLKKAS